MLGAGVRILRHNPFYLVFESSPEDVFSIAFQREKARKGEREKHGCERDTPLGALCVHPNSGRGVNLQPRCVWLAENQTHDPGAQADARSPESKPGCNIPLKRPP